MEQTRVSGGKLYVRIANTIRTLIEKGDLHPGDRLPPLAELAAEFSCSRATVREALSTLRGQGLIEFRHGDGTYVRTASIDMWMEPLDAALLLSLNQVTQLVDLLTVALAGIAGVVAKRNTIIPITTLSHALFRMECAEKPSEESIAAEVSFYLILAELTENPLLDNVIRVLQEGLRTILRVTHQDEEIGLLTCREVHDAIKDGDVNRARQAFFTYGENMSMILAKRRSESRG